MIPPLPPKDEDEDRDHRRCRRTHSSPSSSPAQAAAPGEATYSGQAGRASVHERLGSRVHEAARDPSSTVVLDIDDRSAMSAEASRHDGASRGSDADRTGTKETVTADDAVIVGLLLEGSCTRADV